MITLLTGQPGHGKTAYGLVRAQKLKEEGRTVYAHGIKDLDYDKIGFKHLADPKAWQDLPDGSVVVLDECYDTFPNRNPGAKVPDHVEAMARHRHRGFDFILIAQQGLQLDPFLRGLYEEHVHVKKKFGKATSLRRWASYQSNVNAHCADASDWIRPNAIFQYYTSTVLNTSKLHVPKWLKMVGVTVTALLLMLWFMGNRWTSKIDNAKGAAPDVMGALNDGALTGGRRTTGGAPSDGPKYANAADYAKAHLPRFATMPQTAPIYDGREPTTQPELYCMASGAGQTADGWRDASVTCLTEQGTRVELDVLQARTVARHGTPYNAYRRPDAAQVANTAAAPFLGVTGAPTTPQTAPATAIMRAPDVTGPTGAVGTSPSDSGV